MKNLLFRLCFTTALLLCAAALGAPHKVRVSDPAVAQFLVAHGGKVIADYGAFQILEADDSLLGGSNASRVELRDDLNLIRLNVQTLDTRAPQVKALRKSRGQFSGKRTHLVQFVGPIKPEWHQALQHTGVRIITYIPENAYLVYGDAAALAQLQSWSSNADYVEWESEYADDYKIHPDARSTDEHGNPRDIGTDLFSIQLIADTNTATLAIINGLKLDAPRQDYELDGYRNIVVALPPGRLKEIATQPDVISIQPHFVPKKRDERQAQIMAGAISGGLPTGPGYLSWLASKGFTQAQFNSSGFVVDVADSGFDNGTATPGHFALYPLGDTSKSDRLVYARLEGSPNVGSSLAGCDGHGAINAHIIAGYDDLSGFPHTDGSGYEYDLGICPFVKIGSSVVFDPDNFTSPNYGTLASDAYSSGARISNDSWGSQVGGKYDSDAQTFDHLVRDAQSGVGGSQPMVFVFAAGNEGPCVTTKGTVHGIDSPGSAKNVITVGAAESVRPITAATGGNSTPGDFCSDNTEADSAEDVDCFSSQGPCTDGRMKPDLVAPGTHITGGVPQNSPPPSPSGTGDAISCFNANGVCALPNSGGTGNTNNFFPLGQEFFTVSTGTSHATPAVSGACALVRQYFLNASLTAPSPAMTKAFLINSARYLTGLNAGGDLWSPSQGMGEVNLGNAFDGVARILRDQLTADKFTASGQALAYTGTISDPSKPFRVTVAWTDAPGNTTGAAYKNNLDLTVTVGGNTYKGNIFSGQYSTTGGTADAKNNVESVFLPAGLSGDFTVTVTAANINSDAITFNGSPQQDFALVIYNANSVTITNPPPPFTPANGTYNGLFYENSGVELGRSGSIAIKTTSAGAYSGTLQMAAARASFSGMFNSSGAATNNIVVNGTVLTLGMQMNNTNNSSLAGTIAGPTWAATMLANRAVYSATTNPAPFSGRYTMTIPGTSGVPNLPQGDSYGLVTVDTAGKIKLTGSLADGTKISQSTVAGFGGTWSFFVPLYKGAGQILGWLDFTNSTLDGDVSWIKTAIATAKFYPAGFDVQTNVIGSPFNPSSSVLPDFANGQLALNGGNLTGSITNAINFTASQVTNLSSNKLSLSVSTATGLFKGSVVDPTTGKPIKFSGVVLQNQDSGSGYFLGTNQSGRVSFGP